MSERGTIASLEEIPPAPQTQTPAERPSISVFRKRLRKFRTIKRGYYSFLILVGAYAISFFLPLLINNNALVVRYEEKLYFPLLHYYPAATFGQQSFGEPDYRVGVELLVGPYRVVAHLARQPRDSHELAPRRHRWNRNRDILHGLLSSDWAAVG